MSLPVLVGNALGGSFLVFGAWGAANSLKTKKPSFTVGAAKKIRARRLQDFFGKVKKLD